jgi:hypothetical protein
MNKIDKVKTQNAANKIVVKKPYERASITEHEPLQEAAATVYYYYTYIFD